VYKQKIDFLSTAKSRSPVLWHRVVLW